MISTQAIRVYRGIILLLPPQPTPSPQGEATRGSPAASGRGIENRNKSLSYVFGAGYD